MKPLDPTWWRRIKSGPDEGDYTQQDGAGMLRRLLHAGGGTAGWVVYFRGEAIGQERKLRDAKTLAFKRSRKLIG